MLIALLHAVGPVLLLTASELEVPDPTALLDYIPTALTEQWSDSGQLSHLA